MTAARKETEVLGRRLLNACWGARTSNGVALQALASAMANIIIDGVERRGGAAPDAAEANSIVDDLAGMIKAEVRAYFTKSGGGRD